MLRFLRIATLILMAVCLAVGASIALADTGTAPAAEQQKVEAIDPDRRMIDNSLAAIEPHDIFNLGI
jgi:hypothetical protein